MTSFDIYLQQLQSKHSDLFSETLQVNGNTFTISALGSMNNIPETIQYLKETYLDKQRLSLDWHSFDCTFVHKAIFEGDILVHSETTNTVARIQGIHNPFLRTVSPPLNENVVQGPLDSFTESAQLNLAMMRSKMNSSKLNVHTTKSGKYRQRDVSFLTIEGITDEQIIDRLIKKIESYSGEMNQVSDVYAAFGLNKFTFIPKINTSELPSNALSFLQKGKIIFFLDGLPFALILFNTIYDTVDQPNDENYPLFMRNAIRLTRIIGIFLTLFLPGLYVALVTVNPEILRIELALTIIESRQFVPYPAFVEITLMLIIIELITEASVRYPPSIGSTLGLVGGIVIGQAVVEASLVSNVLIIVIAATTISNATVVGFQDSLSLRFFKYIIVILAAIFGILGILIGMLIISSYLGKVTTFGVPFVRSKKEGIQRAQE